MAVLIPRFEYNPQKFFDECNSGVISPELAAQITSQGFLEFSDGSAALSHETTKAAEYFSFNVKIPTLPMGGNMDSGAVVARRKKTNAGCIVDGMTSEGFPAIIAAHYFAKILMEKLGAQSVFDVHGDLSASCISLLQEVAKETYRRIQNISGVRFGWATIGFVDCQQIPDTSEYRIAAANLGDVALFCYRQSNRQLQLLNGVSRLEDGRPAGGISSDGGDCFASSDHFNDFGK